MSVHERGPSKLVISLENVSLEFPRKANLAPLAVIFSKNDRQEFPKKIPRMYQLEPHSLNIPFEKPSCCVP